MGMGPFKSLNANYFQLGSGDINTGTATSFSEATVVRLTNTATANDSHTNISLLL